MSKKEKGIQKKQDTNEFWEIMVQAYFSVWEKQVHAFRMGKLCGQIEAYNHCQRMLRGVSG